MTQIGKLLPNLDQQSTKILNLTVLQRIDPYVEEILITAAHVTFYEFNIELSQWSRKDVEGSLFVVKRNSQPRFQFIVMNRRSTENLVEDLLGDFEFEVQFPYLLYRNSAQEVNGIWFYNSRECEDVANLFSRILNAYTKVPQKPKVSSTKSEFEELEAVPTMAVMEGPLEPSSTAGTTVTVPDDSAFVNFFNVAMNLGNASNAATHGRRDQSVSSLLSSSHEPIRAPSPQPAQQLPSPVLPASSTPLLPILDSLESSSSNNNNNNHLTNLIKPITFFTPPSYSSPPMMPTISSCIPTAPSPPPPLPPPLHPPLHPPAGLQRPYGTLMLQPFPPPNPPPSLTPASAPPYRPVFTREKVRDTLLRVIQEDQFIDMFYQELLNMQNL